jgi:hypothetical protein
VTDPSAAPQWYAVRCVFQLPTDDEGFAYEERLTLWQAASSDEAIALAEAEASEYIDNLGLTYLELAQSFHLFEPPASGKEVFSLIRESDLPPKEYLDAFFDTGRELQGQQRPEPLD